jgi:D-alanyl-D-alanine-carboxypeptidase/D-alanyl-D-alanine-endopeptidase
VAEGPAPERLAAVLGCRVRPPRRRQALVAGALLDGSTVVRAVSTGPDGPVDEHTVFEIGSITKVFTGIALAACADRGLVEVDEPLQALLPSTARMPAGGHEITLAQLASHSSGLPRMPPGVPPIVLGRRQEKRLRRSTPDDLFAALASTKLKHSPGRRYHYSNLGAALLGHALARRAETTWEELVRTVACEPLGLAATNAVLPSEGDGGLGGRSWFGRQVPPWDFPALAPAGALRSTARDLLRLLHANLADPPGRLARPLTLARSPRFDTGGDLQIGLGWHIMPLHRAPLSRMRSRRGDSPAMVWHNGLTSGFASFAGFVPASGAGVVVLASRFRSVTGLGIRILRELRGDGA